MEQGNAGIEFALVVLGLVGVAMAGALTYVVVLLVRFGVRKPWFFIARDDIGRIERVGSLEARAVPERQVGPGRRIEIEQPVDDDGLEIPSLDGDQYEPVGGSEESAERVGV